MQRRMFTVLAVLAAAMSLSAPAALASPAPSSAAPTSRPAGAHVQDPRGPYDLKSNDNPALGITYNGVGTQATVTTSPGQSYLVEYGSTSDYLIENNNGYCLRMRDAGNGYAVLEQSGCGFGDPNDLWNFTHLTGAPSGKHVFINSGTGKYLGTACNPLSGFKLWGYSNAPGNCIQWIL